MAVELNKLYQEIRSKYNVKLETTSCFEKSISWLHILENIEFAPFLHGDELVFNSSLNEATVEERKNYIDRLVLYKAGGLIVSLQEEHRFSDELIMYCNERQLPLITTSWETPFINITRIFSEILIDKERTDMDLIAAFKNALHYPSDTDLYLPLLEKHNLLRDGNYVVSIIKCTEDDDEYFNECTKRIEKKLQNTFKNCIFFKELHSLVLLSCDYSEEELKIIFSDFSSKYSNMLFGIGSLETSLTQIHRSYTNAQHTLKLCGSILTDNPLCYKQLGIYQILADMKNPDIICPPFVENTLGKLIEYDQEHRSDYITVLKDFFANDCSITQTANATFFHQNTLKYKIKNIKEILGYDIMQNEHRVNIMLSLAILKVLEQKG